MGLHARLLAAAVALPPFVELLQPWTICMSPTQAGYTSLVTAAHYSKLNVVIELLQNGADVNAQTNVSHITTVIVYTTFNSHLNNFKSVVTF